MPPARFRTPHLGVRQNLKDWARTPKVLRSNNSTNVQREKWDEFNRKNRELLKKQKDKEEYERRVAGIKKVLLASKHLAAGDRVTRKAMVEFLAGKHIGENEVFNDKITEAAAQEGGRTKKRPKRVGEVEVDFNKYITYMTMNGALAAAKADAMLQNRAAAATELTQSEQAQLIEDLGLPMFTAKLPTKNILQDEVEKITGTRPPASVRKDKLARTLFDHFRSKEREQEGAGGQGGAGT